MGQISSPPRLLFIFGTRPEVIKLAPVILAWQRGGRPSAICVTGQHRGLLHDALDLFGITPDIDLKLMRRDQRVDDVLARALPALTRVMAREVPDLVVVQGDTVSGYAGALAAFYRGIPVAHVEAGLRSGSMTDPFPEEMHRRQIALMADLHFAPTAAAARALAREGVDGGRVVLTGNSGVDSLLLAVNRLDSDPLLCARINGEFAVWADGKPLVLATIHRRENRGRRLDGIVTGLRMIAEREDCHIVVPVHPSPVVAGALMEGLGDLDRVRLVPPLDYLRFAALLQRAALVLTDSGGVQEEAPALGCPVLVLRDRTERPEGLATGNAELVGTDPARIHAAARRLLRDPAARQRMASPASPYGDGQATRRIIEGIDGWHADRGQTAIRLLKSAG